MFSIIETFATAVLLLLAMMLIIHILRGDAAEWLTNKFVVDAGTKPVPAPTPNQTVS
jgi:hypothetical protein